MQHETKATLKRGARAITQSAVIAAVYTLLTVCIAPISSGLVQCRLSEALCVLPYFTPLAVPGLFIGCLLSNILMGNPMMDIVLGSFATLLAALATYLVSLRVRGRAATVLAPLPAVLFNALIVGYVLRFVYFESAPYLACVLYVGLGQMIACYGAGIPLFLMADKYKHKLFPKG